MRRIVGTMETKGDNVKDFELVGVILAMGSYILIVNGELLNGFILGGIGAVFLALVMLHKKLGYAALLQGFFICANIWGMSNQLGI